MSSSETSGVIVSITEQKVNSYSNMLISVFLKSLILQLLHLFCLCVPSQTQPKDQKPHTQHASYTFPLWATNTLPSSSPQTVSETNLNPSVSLYPPCLARGCICLESICVPNPPKLWQYQDKLRWQNLLVFWQCMYIFNN